MKKRKKQTRLRDAGSGKFLTARQASSKKRNTWTRERVKRAE